MIGHDTVVVQDNAQQGDEVEKLEREEDKIKKEEKEVATTDPVKQQVVQTGGSDQTAGGEKHHMEADLRAAGSTGNAADSNAGYDAGESCPGRSGERFSEFGAGALQIRKGRHRLEFQIF